MAVIKKSAAPKPALPKETVEGIEALGGDVIVRGLLLTERLAFTSTIATERAQAADAAQRGDDVVDVMQHVPRLLALAVIDADGEPVYTVAEWETFGATHQADAMRLFDVALRLSGWKPEANVPNSPASPT